MTKSVAVSLIISLLASSVHAADAEKPSLAIPGNVLLVDKLDAAMNDPWKLAKGKWEPLGGVTRCTYLPEDHHGAVAAISQKGLNDFSVQYDFKFAGSTNHSLALDGNGGHILRITVTPKSVIFGSDGNAAFEPMNFARFTVDFKEGDWHHMSMEVVGDTVFAKVDKQAAYGVSDLFKAPKTGIRLCVGNGMVDFRDFQFHEASLNPEWAKLKSKLPKPLSESVLKTADGAATGEITSKKKGKRGAKTKPE